MRQSLLEDAEYGKNIDSGDAMGGPGTPQHLDFLIRLLNVRLLGNKCP